MNLIVFRQKGRYHITGRRGRLTKNSVQFKLKLSHQLFLLVIIPVIFELVIGCMLYASLQVSGDELRQEAHSRLLLKKVNEVRSEFLWAYQACNEYAVSQGEDRYKLSLYLKHAWAASKLISELKTYARGDKAAEESINEVDKQCRRAKDYTDKFLEAYKQGRIFDFMNYGATVKNSATRAGDILNGMIETQLALLDSYAEKKSKERQEQGNLVLLLVLATGTLISVVALVLSLRISKNFDLLIDNAQRLAAGRELNPPLVGQSELEMLDQEFRRMSQELENTLRKQRAIVDYAADVICSLSPALSFSEMSTAAMPVWGYEPDELLGKRVAAIVHPDDVQKTTDILEGAQKEPVDTFENRVIKKDGSVVDTRWSVRYVEQEKTLVCVAHDISQRKQLERMKQEFVAIVSHDLRSPLTSINMRLGTLAGGMHGDLPADALRIISTIEGSVVRLIRLINDLLDVEKLESGAWDMRFEEKSLLQTMEDATESVVAMAEKKHIEIVLPANDMKVKADHERLTQVMTNIMSNAIKFSPEKSKVTVTHEAHDGTLEVRISDQGPGILEEERALIFDRFRQSKRDSDKKTGSGLGLAICAAIIKEHAGAIGVDSNNGQGSTFWFRIPLAKK